MKVIRSASNSDLWQQLESDCQALTEVHLRDLFAQDPLRFERFSISELGILLDYSKQRINQATLDKLIAFAKQQGLAEKREALFSGQPINISENRAVLHTLLRSLEGSKTIPADIRYQDLIQNSLEHLANFSEQVRSGNFRPSQHSSIKDVICLGIGGSELGPLLAYEALLSFKNTALRFHFVSNIDGFTLSTTLKNLQPESTLCIVSSKSFTTPETLHNANTVKTWFKERLSDPTKCMQHFVAVTAQGEKAQAFGIVSQHIFEFWDFVGGRYSIWSAVGLPVILAIGMIQFKAFLAAARKVDEHFYLAPFEKNIPVIMGLLGFWNRQFWHYSSYAIMPYEDRLKLLPAYLQQLQMESNGKRVDAKGEILSHPSSPIIWGGVGCNGQHAFMQLLHQGTETVPIDFLLPVKAQPGFESHQKMLVASCLTQSQALMQGHGKQLKSDGKTTESESVDLNASKFCTGNRPSNTILYPELTPGILGTLLAIYEHKVFVEGILLNINSFDQWGVELGKSLMQNVLSVMEDKTNKHDKNLDSSTLGLLKFFQKYEK